jgi:hypothetical protein
MNFLGTKKRTAVANFKNNVGKVIEFVSESAPIQC